MRTLSALFEATRRRCDSNIRTFSNGLADLCLTAESDTLVGNVFATQEEFASWFNFAQDFAGSGRVSTPEGASHVDLEELTSRVARTESSPVAGPSTLFLPDNSPTLSSPVVPPIVIQQSIIDASPGSPGEEDIEIDELNPE